MPVTQGQKTLTQYSPPFTLTKANTTSMALGDSTSLGNSTQSVVLGQLASAWTSGNSSVAIGYNAHSYSDGVAVGCNASCSNNYSVAIGGSSAANNTFATAVGRAAAANWDSSIAIGYGATAGGARCLILGVSSGGDVRSIAIGESIYGTSDSVFIGRGSSSTTQNHVIVGQSFNTTTAATSSADGATRVIGGHWNVAIGPNVYMDASTSVGIGYRAKITGTVANAVQIGSGTNSTSNTIQFQTVRLADSTGLNSPQAFTNKLHVATSGSFSDPGAGNVRVDGTVKAAAYIEGIRVVTASGGVTVNASDALIVIRKTAGEATAVSLLAGSAALIGRRFTIKDGKGDAATNNITVTISGGGNIEGAASFVINTNRQAVTFTWDGTEYVAV